MLLRPGEIIKGTTNYHINREITRSSFGAIFDGRDDTGRQVVVKQLINLATDHQEFRGQVNYFKREGEILLNYRHPKVVEGYDYIEKEEDGEYIIVMEKIHGSTLASLLAKYREENQGQPLPEKMVISIGIEICEVLNYLHTLPGQIIYRDMKPENVMWDSVKKTIKLIDFGTARFGDRTKKVTLCYGTDGYAPPELYDKKKDVSFYSDVYATGATLYELLTGSMPAPYKTPDSFQGYDHLINPRLKEIITRAMDQNPEKRYQTALAMKEDLEKIFDGRPEIDTVQTENPYPAGSCFCPKCGISPRNNKMTFCTKDGEKLHTVLLQIAFPGEPVMELPVINEISLMGRLDEEGGIFPDIDISKFDRGRFASRRHGWIEKKGNLFYIKINPDNTNTTFLNEKPLSPGKYIPLKNGNKLRFGNLEIIFVTRPVI